MNNIYFISGIDTDAGKSYCTAWYAAQLIKEGRRVITQKFIQTGNVGHSDASTAPRRNWPAATTRCWSKVPAA